ncbi:MAG TPA: hypothetical protein VEJ20_03360, partial [Candidatus Eremiobacteraceae bacterium]|nr:hypothetical protein [Candidatus Eremiobacteraceae bacterium]
MDGGKRAASWLPSATKDERGWAALWAAFTILAIGGALSLSSWTQRGPESGAFVAVTGCLLSVAFLATAYLLSNRLVISRSPALALLASTYLFCGLAAGLRTFAFPGVEPQFYHGGPDAARWFWFLWHAAAGLGIIGFVALDDEWIHRQRAFLVGISSRAAAARIALGDAGAFLRGPLLLAAVAAGGAAVWFWREPTIFAQWFGTSDAPASPVSALFVLDIGAIVLLAFALRRDNLIRTWLLLAAGASLIDVCALAWSAGPYTIGWYFSQACALVSAVVLPIVLLGDLRKRLLMTDVWEQADDELSDPETGAANVRGLTVEFSRMAKLAASEGVPLTVAVARVDRPRAG